MEIKSTYLPDLKIIKPEIYQDHRGLFYELFNQRNFNELIRPEEIFVQDNFSKSKKNVLRGLHYQEDPFQQAKLVTVISGEIFDVAVDIRKNSIDYGKWFGYNLNSKSRELIWIPEGFAHGFLVLSDYADVMYKVNNYYSKEAEKTLIWNDPKVNINWPIKNFNNVILSDKDKNGYYLKDI